MKPQRVHITGASGTGTTTLGRALASEWSIPHADVDDYFWEPTEPPYTTKRDPHTRLELMDAVFVGRKAWVLSGSLLGWGEALIPNLDAVIFLTLEPTERLGRLKERERQRYGDRIDAGGDLEAATSEFLSWAAGYDDPNFLGRSLVFHEDWLSKLPCPILRLDSGRSISDSVAAILKWEPAEQHHL
ncbi:MAG: AAA family ATPase [Acidimicrobiia bacterium]